VTEWLLSLPARQFGHVRFYIDLPADQGAALEEPYTRQLRGKLRELRFHVGREQVRITYFIGSGRRIVLLTVFARRGSANEPRLTAPGKPCGYASPST
jgi:hypothetical protein